MSLGLRQPAYIEFRAQTSGSIQAICPNCTNFIVQRLSWRCPRVECTRCHRVFTVGIVAFPQNVADLPFNGWYSDDYTTWTNNRLGTYPSGYVNAARLIGRLRWVCPNDHVCQTEMAWEDGKVVCETCQSTYFIAAVLYRARNRQPIRTPVDWIIPESA